MARNSRLPGWELFLVGLLCFSTRLQGDDLATLQAKPLVESARIINTVLLQYAVDHDGAYPTGKSSTEVFQKLIDEKYVTDPALFYFAMDGKTKPTSATLKPENVCWDVTVPVKSEDADVVPMVFSTGYRIAYESEGKAVPIAADKIRIFGIAVAYKGNASKFLRDDGQADHIVPNFIPGGFESGGKTYQQLTPDGVLPPP